MRTVEVADPLVLERLVQPDPTRSVGLHLSAIIKDLSQQLDPERFGGEIAPEFIGVGLAFEDLLGAAIQRLVRGGERPGEFRVDGIALSPDWIAEDGMLEEWKATWTSSREGLDNPKLYRYHLQAMAYTRALGTDQMRFRVLWVNGDYRPPAPTLRTYVTTYTRIEQEENWAMLRQHARDRRLTWSS